MEEDQLTDRELRALSLLAQGRSVSAIARSMSISQSTLRRTLQAARQRLGATSTVNAIYLATRRGLI